MCVHTLACMAISSLRAFGEGGSGGGGEGEQEAADRDLGCVIWERELTMIKLIGIE